MLNMFAMLQAAEAFAADQESAEAKGKRNDATWAVRMHSSVGGNNGFPASMLWYATGSDRPFRSHGRIPCRQSPLTTCSRDARRGHAGCPTKTTFVNRALKDGFSWRGTPYWINAWSAGSWATFTRISPANPYAKNALQARRRSKNRCLSPEMQTASTSVNAYQVPLRGTPCG